MLSTTVKQSLLKRSVTFIAAICTCSAVWVNSAHAQTLKLRFPFDDAGPGTTTASDTSGGGLAVTLNMETSSAGTGTDLHGAASSGIQGTGRGLNLSANPISGNSPASIAFVNNDPNIGSLGTVSSFTATIWFKLTSAPTNTANQGPRLFIIGTNTVNDSGLANSISVLINTAAGFPSNAIAGRIGTSQFTIPLYSPLPVGVWQFFAMTYDGTANAMLYYGTEASPAKLMCVNNVGVQTVNFGTSGTLQIGNRLNGRARGFPGWLDEFRFYTGAGDATFVENIRQASCPVVISGLTPDGSVLLAGTSTLSFTASSANNINTSDIRVSLNGADISSSLVFGGTPTARTVTYSSLPINPTLINNSSLNGATLGIRVTDAGGIVASNLYTYDTFSATNFTFEAEDYNYSTNPPFAGGGNFIDNPRYAFVSAADTYWQRLSELGDDYDDNGGGTPRVYRGDAAETEFSLGAGNNGGTSVGELMRQKILDAFALDSTIRDVNAGFFDGGTGPDLPNWMNYTRTFPSGAFNVYTRAASGGGTLSSTLALVTSGVGTPTQTTTNLGTFTFPNTGGWQSYNYIPLRDAGGNLIRLNLGGVATLRLTAGAAGGGNNNFLMLVPANTNLPVISGTYPNGTNMFQPWPTLSFNVSSPGGFTINPNGISVGLTTTTIQGSSTTNLTSANGLTVTGTATSRNVSLVLKTNATYTAVISATDVNGSPAGLTVTFDTYDPVFLWEAEDYNYNSGQHIDSPQTNGYSSLAGTAEVDYHDVTTAAGTHLYRPTDAAAIEANGDSPPRLAYIGSGFTDYDVGWYDGGDWNNYTHTFPAGDYNIYLRAANGTTGNGGLGIARVTSDPTQPNQTTVPLGSFTIPATGGWQTYTWVPLRDSSGNLVKFTGGGVQTLRATSSGGLNANFYALFPANTNLPNISNLYPNGTNMFQATNRLTFTVTSSAGVNQSSIIVTLDGVQLTSLTFTGSATAWNVSYNSLQLNTNHTVVISATDVNGNNATTSVAFDTFPPNLFTWEAEDYDYNGGQFIDNPPVDAYAGLSAVADVDFHDINTGGAYDYRPTGTATGTTATGRPQFAGTNDWVIGFFGANEWGNYTHTYPAGRYNVWGQFAAGGGDSTAWLSMVTSGWGTTTQTTNFLGTFSIPNSSWTTYLWVPMRDASGNLAKVILNGSTNTIKLARSDSGPDVNVDFMMLVPAPSPGQTSLTATRSGSNINLSFLSQAGFTYQVQYKDNVMDPTWLPLGSPVTGDGTLKTVSDPNTGQKRFYRLFIQ